MRNRRNIGAIAGCLVLILSAACNDKLVYPERNESLPEISDVYPLKGKVGTEVTLSGEHLQWVDSVWIGGGLAHLTYLVNSKEVIVTITNTCRSGEIVVKNTYGETKTSFTFEMEYPVPSLTDYPLTAQPKDEIVLSGTNMDVCSNVYFGTAAGVIKGVREKELVVEVPYFENSPVEISLTYFDGTSYRNIGTGSSDFNLNTPLPSVNTFPLAGEAGSSFTITGENLNLIEEVWFGEEKGSISQQTSASMNLTIPSGFAAATTVSLILKYYGTKELVVTDAFEVTLPDVSTIYYWENKTTQCQGIVDGNSFFSAQTGEVLTPCDYESVKHNITFYASISGGEFQINNPNNSENQTRNFRCRATTGSAVNLPTEVMPTMIRLRTLNANLAEDKKYIDLVKAKTLEKISLDIIKEDGLNYTSGFSNTLKYQTAFNPGDVILFVKYTVAANTPPAIKGTADYSDANIDKIGFIEVVNVNIESTINNSDWTFNCYYQK
ncbi:MAG: IPT/TIG domain-containing protein [Proteiniphilum sp.]|uniref:IPT/TIG domain-containing protein n=1 Tax=Proteiniphilum sp. TaxID=1926877 RepID=UPI002AB93A58|nr:IPT/TIG domain-containing protein [Proteiniphilum sp.]MDY9919967.1 IPT/TIG domain-containing protein [Proteiniphilum sp.]